MYGPATYRPLRCSPVKLNGFRICSAGPMSCCEGGGGAAGAILWSKGLVSGNEGTFFRKVEGRLLERLILLARWAWPPSKAWAEAVFPSLEAASAFAPCLKR